MDSLQELREWCGRDTEALREVKTLKKAVRECENEVVLTEKDMHTVDGRKGR